MSQHITLRPYQREALDAVQAAWREGVQRPAVVLPTGAGKGHPLDTEVPTPDGLRKWGDLQAGDFVFGSNGRPTEVTDVYDRGVLPAYRVTLSDGSSVITDAEHLWTVRDYARQGTPGEVRTLSTADLLGYGLKRGSRNRWIIPMSGTVTPDVDLPVGPYALGSLIANGYLTHTSPVLTTPDEYVIERVCAEHEVTRVTVDETKWCPRFVVRGIQRHIRAMGLDVASADMFIPRRYLDAGTAQRIALLQGLMDGDGSSREGRRSVTYHTTSPRLAEDVRELACSLGGTARIRSTERVQSSSGNVYSAMTVRILMPSDISAISTPRKTRLRGPRRVFEPRRAIVDITRVGSQEIRCIRVAAPDSLYQVTRHHIVTHNTVVLSQLIAEHVAEQGTRAIVLVHRDELADQTVNVLRKAAPQLSVGRVQGADDQTDQAVMVCSVQTLSRARRLDRVVSAQAHAGPVGLIVTDECHHAVAPGYQRVYAGFPRALNAGFTATLARGDGRGLGETWEGPVYQRGLADMIRDGYLVPPRGYAVAVDDLDLGRVRKRGGDLHAGDLGSSIERSSMTDAVVRAYRQHAWERPGLVFSPTVRTATAMADAFTASGLRSEVIHGGTSRADRHAAYARYRSGETRVLTSAMVLTEGFDMPHAACAVIARPTQSQPLYVQMVGRVLRLSPGKDDAVVLDAVGASRTNKLMTLVDLGLDEEAVRPETTTACEGCLRTPCRCSCTTCGARGACMCEPGSGPEVQAVGRGEELDLFAASTQAWLTTRGGVQVIPVQDGFVALWMSRSPGPWDVVHVPERGPWRRLRAGMPLGTAMAWAETEAERLAPFSTRRTARWRARAVSDPQRARARRLGLDAGEFARSGDISDAMGVEWASKRIDPYLRAGTR